MTSLVNRLPLFCKYKKRTCKIPPAVRIIGVKCLSTPAGYSPGNNETEVLVELTPDKTMSLKTGKFAKLADGCALVTYRNTTVMATVISKEKKERASFVPLIVNYQQKAAALGRIPLNFLRREIGQTEHEILTSRAIDRSIRPLFPEGFSWETQIICNPLAIDGSNFPDVLAINAASVALAISDVPWTGPVGAVRVGLIDGAPIVNPTKQELTDSALNLIVTARNQKIVTMLEGAASNVIQADLFKCLKIGVKVCQKIVTEIEKLSKLVGKEKRSFEAPQVDPKLRSAVESRCIGELRSIFQEYQHSKLTRDQAVFSLQNKVMEELEREYSGHMDSVSGAFREVCKNVFRDLIFETGIRCDGRQLTEVRQISCEVDLYEPLHGSALFQRGQTQVLCTVALDSPSSAMRVDKIAMLTSGPKEKNFFVHYEFPPFATKETKKLGPVGRREIGHGALAEKALQSNVPEKFPFTIRLTSEVLESNGSSSMATVCGGSLALMDAGVPLANPCAGVAMGFISRCDDNLEVVEYKILTDLLGIEDYLGEMDFKIAGTRKAFTALQMDVKNRGVSLTTVFEILSQGKNAINEILTVMHRACPTIRIKRKPNWPETKTVKVPVHVRSKFLGPGGINLKRLETQTGVEVTEEEPGEFSVFAPNSDALGEAEEIISKILKNTSERELEFGGVYVAQITEIKPSGCMVTLFPDMKPEYISVTQLDVRQVNHPSALGLQEGQEIRVKYFGRDPVSGAMRLSRKALQGPTSEIIRTLKKTSFSSEEKANEKAHQ